MKDYFMKLFLDYLNKIKLQILLMLFPTILTGMIFLLYQLPLEPILYIAVLWILTGLGTCAFGFHNYQKNIHNLQIISAAPDINLSRMDAPSNEADALQQEIMHSLNRMRIDAETANQKTLEEMTDYYTMWAHQIKTPIFALRLLLQENPTVNKEALTELFKIEQYVEMVLGYLRTEDMSSDLKLSRCALDSIIREQIHKYAGIFISKKLTLTYEGISENVLTDEKWLGIDPDRLYFTCFEGDERAPRDEVSRDRWVEMGADPSHIFFLNAAPHAIAANILKSGTMFSCSTSSPQTARFACLKRKTLTRAWALNARLQRFRARRASMTRMPLHTYLHASASFPARTIVIMPKQHVRSASLQTTSAQVRSCWATRAA